MIVVLDFDRTLFNTDRMKRSLAPRIPSLVAGVETFLPGELWRFIYPDVWRFLRTCKVPLILVSAVKPSTTTPTNLAFQRAKVAACGITHHFDEILFTEGLKGPLMARRYRPSEQGGMVFIDDMDDQLRSVATHCPFIRRVKIDRTEGAVGDGHSVITSLNQLFPLMQDHAA